MRPVEKLTTILSLLRVRPLDHFNRHLLVLLTHSALSAYTAHFAQAESQTQTGIICPSLALLAHSAPSPYTAQFAQAESHTQTGVICPSLALLAHSAHVEDIARFARAESALLE